MFIVTGASGQLGRMVVERLRERVPAERIGVSVRDPGKVADLAARGVRVRRGDFAEPSTLPDAFEGGDRMLLVSFDAAATGGDPVAQHRAAIAAAKAAGVSREIYTSQVSAAPDAAFPPGRSHFETEGLLAASGLLWTSLRHGFYASSGQAMIADGLAKGSLLGPQGGPVAWTTHGDLAEADAAVLLGEGPEIDGTAVLTSRMEYDYPTWRGWPRRSWGAR